MKKLVIALLLFSSAAAAQKKPSAAEMEKQMKAAQKEIDELEKVDPEAAKMAKQMLQQMQARTSQPAAASVNKPLPVFASPITSIKTPPGLTPPTDAQATGQLLWYKGKRINDSMLITAKGSVVLYSKKTDRIIVQPKPGSDPFKAMVEELIKSESRKQQLADQAAKMKNGFFYYPLIVECIAEVAATDKRY